jgi:HPt (histidine-containing phosphotransfer) domain-containing protein
MGTPDVKAQEFRRQLNALGAEYRARLPEKVASIARLWGDLASGVLPPAFLTDLRRELHTLAGTATTFGVPQASKLAAAAEFLLEPFCERGTLPEGATAAELTRLLDALRCRAGNA